MEKLIATLLIVVTLIGLTIGQNNKQTEVNTPSSTAEEPINVTAQTSNKIVDELSNVVTIGDTSGKPFYKSIPPTPEILKLQKELAELEQNFPQFEKEKEAEIAKLTVELAEMEKGIEAFQKEKEKEIAEIEKSVTQKKGGLTDSEKKKEAEIAKINQEITKKEAELVIFSKKIDAENKQLEATIAEKKKERDSKTTTKHTSIDGEIQSLYGQIQSNLGEIQSHRGEIQGLYGAIQGIRGEMQGNRGELQGQYGEIQGLRGEIMGKRGEIQGKRGEIQGVRGEIMGKQGEIMGKRGEIQGKYTRLVYETLVSDLKKDNIITEDKKLTLRLSNTEMFVNDIKQSDAIHAKYKEKYLKDDKREIEIYKRNGNLNISFGDDDN